MPPSTAGDSANSLRVEYTGPDRPVIEILTITSDHSPLDNSGSASLMSGTIWTCQPSESSTCRRAVWLTTSSSMIRIPILATTGPLATTEYSVWPAETPNGLREGVSNVNSETRWSDGALWRGSVV